MENNRNIMPFGKVPIASHFMARTQFGAEEFVKFSRHFAGSVGNNQIGMIFAEDEEVQLLPEEDGSIRMDLRCGKLVDGASICNGQVTVLVLDGKARFETAACDCIHTDEELNFLVGVGLEMKVAEARERRKA